jgi:hypothetical protein
MRRMFSALGIDFDQWKALTAVMLKLDFRPSSTGHAARQLNFAAALLVQIVFYMFFGVGMAILVLFSRDLFLAATLAMAMTTFIIGTAVLLDHNSAITSPNDYAILGFRPITSRTYFAVRLTNVLVYTTALTTIAVWLPVAALFFRYGVAVGAAGIAAFYACSTSTTLAILTGYTWMLRLFGQNAIKRALSYLQLVMSFFVSGGYLLISSFATERYVASLTLPKTAWLLLVPVTWFASYLELAAGRTGPREIIPAAASVLAMAALASSLGGRLSLQYSEQLGAMLTASTKKDRQGKEGDGPSRWHMAWPFFRAGEARSIALLVRSQFRHDQRFRMGVLSILPMTLLYVFMGVRNGALGDPFVHNGRGPGFSLVTMAVLMFPSILKLHLTRSEAFRASWIFFACPGDRMKIVRASKDVLVVFFLLPYLAFLTAIFVYIAGNVLHVAVHVALLGLISHLILQISLFAEPDLPFSKPPAQKGQNTSVFFVLLVGIAVLSGVIQAVSPLLYSSLPGTVVAFGVVVAASLGVDRLTRARVERETASLEFEG